MASSSLPRPGTKGGPCPEPCRHLDCARTRAEAEQPCDLCGGRIGYETPFYATPDWLEREPISALVHASCLEDEADRQREAQP
jgi:hypothetical protein